MSDVIADRLRRAEAAFGGTLSVAAARLDGGGEIRLDDRRVVPAASTIKVFLLLALLERVAAGRLRLDEERVVGAEDRVPGTGVLKTLAPGRPWTLGDLATLMIVVSDNTATNLLVDAVGVDAVADACDRHGWRDTRATGKLQTGEPPSTTSARDLTDLLVRLARGELLPERETVFALRTLERQQGTALGRELGHDPYATETGEDDLVIAAKNGALRGVRHDAGLIRRGGRGFALAVLVTDLRDRRFHDEHPGLRLIGRVARLLHDELLGAPAT